MEDTVYENHSVVELKTSLVVRELEEGLYAYKRAMDTKVSKKSGKLGVKPHVSTFGPAEGIVDTKNLDLLVRGKSFTPKNFVCMNAEQREFLRTHTMHGEAGTIFRSLNGEPVDAFIEGFDVDDLVTMNFSDYTMFDRHGDYLPTAVYADYITAQMHNGSYDLDKAAAILLARGDVRLLGKKEGSWRDEPDMKAPDAKTIKEAIFSVPSYNSSERHSECIYYIWGPSANEFRTLMDYCHTTFKRHATKKPKGKYHMDGVSSTDVHRAIFELDLLGLRQYGAARKKSFYGD